MIASRIGRAWAEDGANLNLQLRLIGALIAAFPARNDDARLASRGADANSGVTPDLYATTIAEKLGIPYLSA